MKIWPIPNVPGSKTSRAWSWPLPAGLVRSVDVRADQHLHHVEDARVKRETVEAPVLRDRIPDP